MEHRLSLPLTPTLKSQNAPSDDASTHVDFSPAHVTDPGRSNGGVMYKLLSPGKLPIGRVNITILPCLRSTSFLESPVLPSGIKAEHFPITGSLPKPPFMYGSGESAALSLDKSRHGTSNADERKPSSFEFKFHVKAASLSGFTSFTIPAVLKQNEPFSSFDQKESLFSVATDRSSDDGYNWRKYGQKLVKGSEFPRSYYKCTYPSCEVRKIYESFPSGQITEIFYNGSHDHPKPAGRRHNPSVLTSIQEEKFSKDFAFAGQDDKPDIKGIELKSPAWAPPQASEDDADCSDPQIQNINIDEDDISSKRRKVEREFNFASLAKPIREPRIVVQTVSEVDVLDDGYRWRKYGQKVVRGNLNPRSYYKCTNPECPVRKHVERAPHDLNAVLTTYEGKHNHDVPTAKNNSHEISRTSSRVLSPRKLTSEHSGSISLDLGVGITHTALSQTNE